jgi:hypothetical protein
VHARTHASTPSASVSTSIDRQPSNLHTTSPQVLNRAGNANYNAIVYDANTSTVYARPPLYGYLMLQQSFAGGADIVGRSVSPSGCKVWLLKGRGDGSLRAVVINKSGQGSECAADVQLDAAQARRYSDQAAAEYIHAPGGLDERWRVFYSNWYYDVQGSARLREAKTVPLQR